MLKGEENWCGNIEPICFSDGKFRQILLSCTLRPNFRARGLADVHILNFGFSYNLLIFLLSALKFHIQDTNPFKSKESSRRNYVSEE